MKYTVYIVVDTEDKNTIKNVQSSLEKLCTCSFSPFRKQETLFHCVEFYATIKTESFDQLLPKLNTYWKISQQQWADYGYNTKMFHPNVYYLEIIM